MPPTPKLPGAAMPAEANAAFVARWAASMRRHPATLAALGAGLLATAASFVPEPARDGLIWHGGTGMAAPWRLLTAHFVHLSSAHLAVNLIAAAMIAWTCDRLHMAGRLAGAALASLIGVDLGLAFAPWNIAWYAGFSGALHGVFAWLCLALALDPSTGKATRGLALALLSGGAIKVLAGLATPVGTPGWLGVPEAAPAHFYGYLAGALWAFSRREK